MRELHLIETSRGWSAHFCSGKAACQRAIRRLRAFPDVYFADIYRMNEYKNRLICGGNAYPLTAPERIDWHLVNHEIRDEYARAYAENYRA